MKGVAKGNCTMYNIREGQIYELEPTIYNADELVRIKGIPGIYFKSEFIILEDLKPKLGFWKKLLIKLGIADEVS
jgi:hypothetical protein